jgi:hypothetical protein
MQGAVVEALHQEQAVQVEQVVEVLEEVILLMLHQELLILVVGVEELQAIVALIPQVALVDQV